MIQLRLYGHKHPSRPVTFEVLLAVLATIVLAAIPTLAQGAGDRYETELEPLLKQFIQQQQIPGLAIAILENNQVVYEKGFGWESLDRRSPVTPLTVFHMASITKPFVATAILQLAEQNKVDLDEPVVKYLSYFRLADERYKVITVRQMVTHISGIPDVTDYQWNKPQFDDGALERYARSLSNLQLLFGPGAKFAYSNIAYEVLGDVIAKASGESFEEYVQHYILTPLGMKNSTLLYHDVDPQLMSNGHVLDSQGNPEVSKVYPYNRTHSPSSNLHSNLVDMTRWAMVNMNRGELGGKRILQASTYDLMWKPAEEIGEAAGGTPVTSEGTSWFLGEYRGNFLVTHSGGDIGFITDLAMLPDKKIAVIWMVNCDWIDTGPINGPITYAALDVALRRKPEPIALKRSLARTLYFTFQKDGIASALDEYQLLKKQHPDLYDFREKQLGELGGRLLREGYPKDAVEIFQLNVTAYPSSAGAYDCLADAYLVAGNKSLAIANYKKALQLDPTLAHAVQALKKLKEQ